jgi:hypothetical protein
MFKGEYSLQSIIDIILHFTISLFKIEHFQVNDTFLNYILCCNLIIS